MLDITGLKNFQSELQRERDFSSKILNHTQSLILVVDTAGLISYGNRRWYDAGYEQKQILGRPLLELAAPARRQVLSDALNATVAGHQVDNLDLQIYRGDGRLGQFSVNLSPMRDEQGSVTSIVVVMTDITDAAMLQSKLMHAEKMAARSEEHTSELQSRGHLVCRLLLEKKNITYHTINNVVDTLSTLDEDTTPTLVDEFQS